MQSSTISVYFSGALEKKCTIFIFCDRAKSSTILYLSTIRTKELTLYTDKKVYE